MKYCTKCGAALPDDAAFCSRCGCAVGAHTAWNAYRSPSPQNALLTKLSERVKTNSIIWFVIAAIQILVGLDGAVYTLIVGVLNIISAVNGMSYSKTILENPNGIVKNYESLTSPVITLVYNLAIGGVIGVVGSIYYFICIRGFVMENKDAFLALETQEETANA